MCTENSYLGESRFMLKVVCWDVSAEKIIRFEKLYLNVREKSALQNDTHNKEFYNSLLTKDINTTEF